MRISDWSSDVCSSDLDGRTDGKGDGRGRRTRTRAHRPLRRDLGALPLLSRSQAGDAQAARLHRLCARISARRSERLIPTIGPDRTRKKIPFPPQAKLLWLMAANTGRKLSNKQTDKGREGKGGGH